MKINWFIVIGIVICAIVLVIYLIKQNQKDKKDLVKKLNEDYKKAKETEFNDER